MVAVMPVDVPELAGDDDQRDVPGEHDARGGVATAVVTVDEDGLVTSRAGRSISRSI